MGRHLCLSHRQRRLRDRHLRRRSTLTDVRTTIGAALTITALILGACGDGDDGPSEAEVRDAFIDLGFEPTEARCYVGQLYDDWSKEDREALVRLDSQYEDFSTSSEQLEAAEERCLQD